MKQRNFRVTFLPDNDICRICQTLDWIRPSFSCHQLAENKETWILLFTLARLLSCEQLWCLAVTSERPQRERRDTTASGHSWPPHLFNSPEDDSTAKWQHFRNQDGGLLLLLLSKYNVRAAFKTKTCTIRVPLIPLPLSSLKPNLKVLGSLHPMHLVSTLKGSCCTTASKTGNLANQIRTPTGSFCWLMCVFCLLISDYLEWII